MIARAAQADPRMVTGQSLGIWKSLLMADKDGREAFAEMLSSDEFNDPIEWKDIQSSDYDGIILPGGHAPGMREYLESNQLQTIISQFFNGNKLIAAICHGTVLAARSQNDQGQCILSGKSQTMESPPSVKNTLLVANVINN